MPVAYQTKSLFYRSKNTNEIEEVPAGTETNVAGFPRE